MTTTKPVPGTGGDHYIPYSERSGAESAQILPAIRQLSCIPANLTGLTLFRARGLKT